MTPSREPAPTSMDTAAGSRTEPPVSSSATDGGLAPWRSPLLRALHRNRSLPNARYLQLATVTPAGRPANRTVVFRGFFDGAAGQNLLKFVSDRRSEKVEQLLHQDWAEVCWYFPKTREQFRLAGRMRWVGAPLSSVSEPPKNLAQDSPAKDPSFLDLTAERRFIWQSLSDSARSQFYWPQPGAVRTEQCGSQSAPVSDSVPDPVDVQAPADTFVLLLLSPDKVDHLELRGEPQNRFLYRKDENEAWSCQSINP